MAYKGFKIVSITFINKNNIIYSFNHKPFIILILPSLIEINQFL